MAGGKMFGDLKKFRDGDFLAKNHRGVLLTPEWDYDLDIIAAGRYDAYDADVYTVGDRVPADRILAAGSKRIENRAAPDEEMAADEHGLAEKRIVALSTCVGDMTSSRILVFCEMKNRRPHE